MTRKTFLKLLALTLGGVTVPLKAEKNTKRAPALFVGHGSPMNAIDSNSFTKSLRTLGRSIPKPKAILAISAHWHVPYGALNNHESDELMYDMYGFPEALYDVEYPAPHADMLVSDIKTLFPSLEVEERSLDHGVWSVLVHLFPEADIPVMQLSMDRRLTMQEHFDIGRKLGKLREHGVMILGSGNITHNLRDIHPQKNAPVAPWAKEFDDFVKEAILNKDYESLIAFQKKQRYAAHAHPSIEHYLPLLYVAGSACSEDRSQFPYEGFEHGTLSMRNWMLT